CLCQIELCERRVVRTRPRDQHVVDRRQLAEKSAQRCEIRGIEGCSARTELAADALQPIRVARGKDHLGSLRASAPRRLEPDARAAADDDDRLPFHLSTFTWPR